jgi:uncharacterized membrane protein YphA (DoxX/SURF4 family)
MVALYSFFFLLLVVLGAGAFSLDGIRGRRAAEAAPD